MDNTYRILNCITLNVTGDKYNAIATPSNKTEIKKHKPYFVFDFSRLTEKNTIYKICIEGEPNIIQGFVAFHESGGFYNAKAWKHMI